MGVKYCPRHEHQAEQRQDERRGTSTQRGYNGAWRKARMFYLAAHQLCECDECRAAGRATPSTVVDHIIPHRGNYELFWDSKNNWMAMSARCHNLKTVKEDGGFGNPKRSK